MLPAGKLRTRLRLENEVRVSNGRGGYTTAWTEVANIRGWKQPLKGDEVLREGIIRAVSFSRIVIRYRAGVSPQHRLVEIDGGRIWEIKSVDDPDDRRERLEMVCESGATS